MQTSAELFKERDALKAKTIAAIQGYVERNGEDITLPFESVHSIFCREYISGVSMQHIFVEYPSGEVPFLLDDINLDDLLQILEVIEK